jgi:hypothetical protein
MRQNLLLGIEIRCSRSGPHHPQARVGLQNLSYRWTIVPRRVVPQQDRHIGHSVRNLREMLGRGVTVHPPPRATGRGDDFEG